MLAFTFASNALAFADKPPVEWQKGFSLPAQATSIWLMTTPIGRSRMNSAGRHRHPLDHSITLARMSDSSLVIAQANPPTTLPLLVLPPGATTEPSMFVSMMQMGDTAMVRGDIIRARALYERAAAIHPVSSAALIAAGKTYDPNVLPLFGGNSSFADVAKARAWYERARALGDPNAAGFLASLR